MSNFPLIIQGLSGSTPSIGGSWEGTINLYQDDEGYLTNYPGRTDFFHRVNQPAAEPPERSTAPALDDSYTRIAFFVDYLSIPHLVVVKGKNMYEVYGNTLVRIHVIDGQNIEGLYYPMLFVHESKLIIMNEGDIPYIWDGVDGVAPLGVQETPVPPQVWSTPAPGTDGYSPFAAANVFLDGIWEWSHVWWPQTFPVSGPSSAVDADGNKQPGLYQMRVQFKDKYGNRGPASAASSAEHVDASLELTDNDGTPNVYHNPRFLGCDLTPPQHDTHIYYMVVGRTTNLNLNATTYAAGAEKLCYVSTEIEGTTLSRHVSQLSDANLVLNGEMDLMVRPFFAAKGGFSFRGRIFGYKDNLLDWSDALLFGQTRASQRHVAYDMISWAGPVGDRVAVLTRSSIEVLYQTDSGAFGILDQDFSQGSTSPDSFVPYGTGIFGLFTRGFGFFDGVKVTPIQAPYYIQNLYQDQSYRVSDAKMFKDRYIAVIRKDFNTEQPNYLLMYDFKANYWSLLQENVRGLAVWMDVLLGVKDSIYEMFRGTYPAATLKVSMLSPEGLSIFDTKPLVEISLLMEPSSSEAATLEIKAKYSVQESETSFLLLPGDGVSVDRLEYTIPYWNRTGALYADSPPWSVPGTTLITPSGNLPVHGYSHELSLTLPEGHLFRMQALQMFFGQPAKADL